MVYESIRAHFERVREQRESRDRAIRLRRRILDASGDCDADPRDVGKPAGLGAEQREPARSY